MIIPTPGSIVKTICVGKERIITVKEIVLTHDNLYLIRYDDKDGKESSVNCSLVTEIIYHNNLIPKPINYFDKYDEYNYIYHTKKKYCGSLLSIAASCMSKLSYNIDRPLDPNKLYSLFEKSKPGLVGKTNYEGYPILRKDKIKTWAAKNWSKFLCDKKEWLAEIVRRNKEIADQYWEDVERDMNDNKETY